MNALLMDEEIYWKQRLRADWLREGDNNTKFFHAKSSAYKRKKKIWGIENSHGSQLKEKEEIESEFSSYFQEFFTTTSPTPNQIKAVLKEMPAKVSPKMNAQLEKRFTVEDIAEALSQMCPTKAPGPNGLPAAFFP